MQVGYICVSTVCQNTARQEVLVQELGVEKMLLFLSFISIICLEVYLSGGDAL